MGWVPYESGRAPRLRRSTEVRTERCTAEPSTEAPQKLKSLASLDVAWDYASAHIASFASRHPRTLAASVSVALAGFPRTAFDVAPQVPDAADLPKRTIVENVPTLDLHAQIDALAGHDLELFRSEITRASDTADSLLARLNVADARAAAFLRSDPIARRLLEGRAGKRVQARIDSHGALVELLARYAAPAADKLPTQFTRLRVQRIADRLVADLSTAPLTSQVLMAGGTIVSSLFNATDDAGIPDAVATQLAEIFANDIDFRHELKRGATFSVVYESLTADGEPISWGPASGRVLAAEFVNQGRTFSADRKSVV